MKETMRKALQSLIGQGQATGDELEEAKRAVAVRLEEVEGEISTLDANGPERRKVLDAGTPEELQELDAKLARLTAERTQLYHRRSSLHEHLTCTRAREGLANAKQLHKELVAAAEQAERAIADADLARAKAHQAAQRILLARQNCSLANIPSGDLVVGHETAKRVAAAAISAERGDHPALRQTMAVGLATTSRY